MMIVADNETARTMNMLARKQLIMKILADISMDINICYLEGWCYKEYIEEIKQEIDRIVERCENGN